MEALADGFDAVRRHSRVEIDTTRLLSRVTRAFQSAQQRDGELRLRLSPPELGSLRLLVQIQDGALVARLETETSAAKTAIIDNLPALRERLAEQGLRVERFDVDLMQQQSGGMPDRPRDQERDASLPIRNSVAERPRGESSLSARSTASAIDKSGRLNVII
jgi:flagellar hook-length control protein FliK